MDVEGLKLELAYKCKNGIYFILAAAIMWVGLCILWASQMQVSGKTMLTFFVAPLMLPLAFVISRLMKAVWTVPGNPLGSLGMYITNAQVVYFPLVIWAFTYAPYRMPMFLAIITGAHFLPFAWLYSSRAYAGMAGVISLATTIYGWNLPDDLTWRLPLLVAGLLLIMAAWLWVEYLAKSRQWAAIGKA